MADAKTFSEGDIQMLARRIQRRLLADITDRRGWKQEWDQMNDGIQAEIATKHREIILVELRRYPETEK